METTYRLSEQQEAVVDWALTGSGNLNLVARAGCGKTSTLKALVKVLARHASNRNGILMGAYNVPIKDELVAWLGQSGFTWKEAVAKTWHGVGYAAWKKIAPRAFEIDPDDGKVGKIFDGFFPKGQEASAANNWRKTEDHPRRIYREFVTQAVGYAKNRAFGVLQDIDDRGAWFRLVDHFDLEDKASDGIEMGTGIEIAIRVYKESLRLCYEVIDFDDMILAPLYYKARFWQYSWVMIDEAQDTNPARRALALASLRPGGRLIAVGDPAQAIYGFTGADADSMDLIRQALNSSELPLNVTYRCGSEIVALAQTWVPDITAHPSAPAGTVRTVALTQAEATRNGLEPFEGETLGKTDAILCRKTAPLVDLAFNLLRRGIGCQIEGRKDLAQGLLKVALRFKVKTLDAMLRKLDAWKDAEMTKWMAKGKEDRAGSAVDTAETITVIANALIEKGKNDVADLEQQILSMFGDTKEGEKSKVLTLSTIHKSKGREWDRVYILGRNTYQPSKWARKDWQMEQESNLMYVAVTRAKQELVDIWVEEEVKQKERGA